MAKDIETKEAFETLVKQSESVVVVDFWAPWCGPCRNFAPTFDKAAETVGDAAQFVKVNVDNFQDIANEYGIRSIPTVLFIKDGNVVDKVSGSQSEDKIVKLVRTHASEPSLK